MSGQTLDALDVIDVVRDHLGAKVTDDWVEVDDSVRFVLYDAFAVRATPDDYGGGSSWGMGLIITDGISVSNLLGRKLTLLETPEQIEAAIDVVDQCVRLRLGAEYLALLDATHPSP